MVIPSKSIKFLVLLDSSTPGYFWGCHFYIMPKFAILLIMFHQTASLNASAPGVLSTWSAAGSGGSRLSATGELRSTATSGARQHVCRIVIGWKMTHFSSGTVVGVLLAASIFGGKRGSA